MLIGRKVRSTKIIMLTLNRLLAGIQFELNTAYGKRLLLMKTSVPKYDRTRISTIMLTEYTAMNTNLETSLGLTYERCLKLESEFKVYSYRSQLVGASANDQTANEELSQQSQR